MGQTLTHGVYLPDEGERNCYSGLAANWQLLDTSVGTIAEHTSALSGKAPLVHTHSKSDITDFPAYGNAAGTICEGNDARLSDARTPVAHTHTKSDVTNLLNSNFIPSANNAYDLGSNSYQWNNLYAKNYYYNGVAWGLDKANKWSETQIIRQQVVDIVNNPSAKKYGKSLYFSDGTRFWSELRPVWNTDGSFTMELGLSNYTTGGAQGYWNINANISKDFSTLDFYTSHNNANLGTSTNKWKTLNGINPGALCLPSGGTTENTDWFNVAGDILPTGGNATSFSGATANYFTPAKAGWLALAVKNCSELSVWCETLKYGISIVAPDASLNRQVVIPVVAGKSYQILITGNSWGSARLIMPQGNV